MSKFFKYSFLYSFIIFTSFFSYAFDTHECFFAFRDDAVRLYKNPEIKTEVDECINLHRPSPFRLPQKDEEELSKLIALYYLEASQNINTDPSGSKDWNGIQAAALYALKISLKSPLRFNTDDYYSNLVQSGVRKNSADVISEEEKLSRINRFKISHEVEYLQRVKDEFSQKYRHKTYEEYQDNVPVSVSLDSKLASRLQSVDDFTMKLHFYLSYKINELKDESHASERFYQLANLSTS